MVLGSLDSKGTVGDVFFHVFFQLVLVLGIGTCWKLGLEIVGDVISLPMEKGLANDCW